MSQLLRTVQMVAASKPTSSLSADVYFLSHLAPLGDLNGQSGLFPSRLRSLSPAVYLPTLVQRYSEFGSDG